MAATRPAADAKRRGRSLDFAPPSGTRQNQDPELVRMAAEVETLAREAARLETEKLQHRAAYQNLKDMEPGQVKLSPQMQQLVSAEPAAHSPERAA